MLFSRSCWLAHLLIVVVIVVSYSTILQAASSPTPDQIELFKQLSPEQQAAAIKALSQSQATTTQSTSKIDEPLATPQVVTPVPAQAAPTDAKIEQSLQSGTDVATLQEDVEIKEVNQTLKQFGYDLFAGTPSTFAPATDIPIPSNYIVGPGDTVQVQLFGKENAEYELVVSREGKLRFPGIGPISVAGLSFDKLTENLQKRIKSQMIGVKANITMGTLRSIRIFVLGDAIRPGSYTVSALSNMTNALFVSGGIKAIGSLRNIELKRQGEVVTQLDLYDLLLHGDTSGDMRLQPGDVIFIPPIGKTVGVAGEVRRPAIYELKNEQTIQDALAFAGGLLPTAYPKASQLERITAKGLRTLIDIDATRADNLAKNINDGDVLRVYSILEKMENIVLLSGHVQRPGGQQWIEGMKLTDVIPSIDVLSPKPDLHYLLIKREIAPDRHIEVITARLDKALADVNSPYNTVLKPRDEVILFGIGQNRVATIAPIITQLKQQSRYNQPALIATIHGNVKFPGVYPLYQGMRVGDLIRAAFDILPKTDMHYALISREIDAGERIKVFSFALEKIINQTDPSAQLELMPQDQVYIFGIDDDRHSEIDSLIAQLKQQTRQGELSPVVSITGYVKAPGTYPLEANMRISDLIQAAGNLTESAYTISAELSRYEIVNGEYREVEHFTINSSDIFNGNVTNNIALKAYDQLHIKQVPQWVDTQTIELIGEVRFPGVYPFHRGETLHDVLKRAGGLTDQAFAQGAIFVREELKRKEQEQLESMAARLESDLAAAKLEQSQNVKTKIDIQTLSLGDSLLKELKTTEAVGRLVIDLPKIVDPEISDEDGAIKSQQITLKNGDKLYVPQQVQEVTIIGEVQQSTSHLYSPELDRNDYISMSGGLTYKADDDRIYIVRANGAVVSDDNAGWFGGSNDVRAGDTIVVPLDADRMNSLTLWTNVTQIVYQLGVAAAAWNSIGIFN